MAKRALSLLLASLVLCSMLWGIPMTASAAGRYKIKNPWVATGADIIDEARKWAGTGAVYRSGVEPWGESVKWRTGYASDGQVSFDCSGFVGRVLNDCGFRATTYTPAYGTNILSQTYKRGYIAISIEELVNYGTDISDAVEKAKNGDYSDLHPGDVIGWTGGTLGRHVIFYAGLNNGVPWMVEMTGRGFLDRAVTPEYQEHFQYGARFAYDTKGTMLVQCTYPAHCKLTVRQAATRIMSLPITKQNENSSTLVEQAYPDEPPYIATALLRNKLGELWYKVKTTIGKTGYLYAGDAEYLGQLVGLRAADIAVPAHHTEGDSYGLTGKITAGYSHLTRVSYLIYGNDDRTGTPKAGTALSVTGNDYSLSGSAVDKKTAFGSLAAGTYACIVSGSYINYYAKTPDTVDVNLGSAQVYEAVFRVTAVPAVCNHSYTTERLASADCEKNGMLRYTCGNCGSSYTECILATGHDYFRQKFPATIREEEKICHTCQNCGDAYARYTGVVYKPGDIDCSGGLDTEDAVYLLLHISMPELYPLELEESDLDGNGTADTEDVVLLLLHISMPDLYPLN